MIARMFRTLLASLSAATLEERLYRTICLLAGVVAVCVVFPANQFQHLPRSLDIVILSFGACAFGLYWQAMRGRQFVRTLFVAIMLVLAGAWFLNGGPSGSVGYFLFAASLYPGIFFRGRERWLMWGVVAVSGLGLLTASHFYPQLVVPFASPLDRFIDVTTGYVFAATTCFLMLVVVATAYDGERRRQEALNRELADVLELNRRRTAELQVSLAEIRTLEGLLPICASCKKIRDDRGDWQQMEVYVMGRTGATFSHGLCPDCLRSYEESPPPAAGQ